MKVCAGISTSSEAADTNGDFINFPWLLKEVGSLNWKPQIVAKTTPLPLQYDTSRQHSIIFMPGIGGILAGLRTLSAMRATIARVLFGRCHRTHHVREVDLCRRSLFQDQPSNSRPCQLGIRGESI
jgi:hypothetical protein